MEEGRTISATERNSSAPVQGRGSPRILLLGGLEPSGRAGLLADIETVRRMRATPLGVATALTAQGTKTFRVDPVSPRTLTSQLRALLELGPIHAVKLGMIPSPASLAALRRALSSLDVPWVVDPVVLTSKGEPLSSLRPRDYLELAAPHVVLTPNAIEAAWMLTPRSKTRERLHPDIARMLGEALVARGFGGVIVKGGHLEGAPIDFVCTREGVTRVLGNPRARKTSQRGTGCRFASACAVALAHSNSIEIAARRARREVENFLRRPIIAA